MSLEATERYLLTGDNGRLVKEKIELMAGESTGGNWELRKEHYLEDSRD